MPHLSPMNWLVVPLLIISTLLCFSTILWWQFMPLFSADTPSSKVSHYPWKWW